MNVRRPAAAGAFYPSDPAELRSTIEAALAAVRPSGPGTTPRAVIAPHAGYRYSGSVAASAYLRMGAGRGTIRRVVLVGPAHRFPLPGVAASDAEALQTPLGTLAVDTATRDAALDVAGVALCDAAFEGEHSVEVHLPFLQVVLGDVQVVPLLAGYDADHVVADVLGRLWRGPDTAVVISTDLSHYQSYDRAVALDRATAAAIVRGDASGVTDERACGAGAVRGLLRTPQCQALTVELADLRNSGDTAGPADHVVGYGAFVLS